MFESTRGERVRSGGQFYYFLAPEKGCLLKAVARGKK